MSYNPPHLLDKQKELLELLYDCSEDFALLESVWHVRSYSIAMNRCIKMIAKTKEIQLELNKIYKENHKQYLRGLKNETKEPKTKELR
jgi:hypothetical protein